MKIVNVPINETNIQTSPYNGRVKAYLFLSVEQALDSTEDSAYLLTIDGDDYAGSMYYTYTSGYDTHRRFKLFRFNPDKTSDDYGFQTTGYIHFDLYVNTKYNVTQIQFIDDENSIRDVFSCVGDTVEEARQALVDILNNHEIEMKMMYFDTSTGELIDGSLDFPTPRILLSGNLPTDDFDWNYYNTSMYKLPCIYCLIDFGQSVRNMLGLTTAINGVTNLWNLNKYPSTGVDIQLGSVWGLKSVTYVQVIRDWQSSQLAPLINNMEESQTAVVFVYNPSQTTSLGKVSASLMLLELYLLGKHSSTLFNFNFYI